MPDPRLFPITTSLDVTVAVPDTSVVISVANDGRRDIEIVNDSDVVVYISRTNPAIVGVGMRLNPYGGSYSMDMQNFWLGQFCAICNPGENGSLTISEGSV